uniref:Transmembrane and coiled-coil domains protein 1 n=1 Tax=Ascaris suum TaxID=6253 RepID=F1KZT8_ASCSU
MNKVSYQQLHEPHLNESEGSAEHRGGSVRSSDGGGSFSGCEDFGDERLRIERKMEQIKERLTRISLAREADVDDFLSVTSNMGGGQENPQIARVRQHFEKKNKKHAQETEHLQKKLEQLQAKLCELDTGVIGEPSPKSAVLSNIRKTGPLLREVTGSVISAPRGIAHMIKNTFGSADNIPDSLHEGASNVGHSTFYPHDVSADDRLHSYSLNQCEQTTSEGGSLRHRIETLPAIPVDFTIHSTSSDAPSTGPSPRLEGLSELREEVREHKQQIQLLVDQLGKIQTYLQAEFNFYNGALHEERIKAQKLEEVLNETIELHQAEMIALRSDLNTIGTRMDYQYCDRFRSIEENIESTQNKMVQMETNVREWLEARPQSVVSSMMLMGANVLVEFLKLILFVISFALDFVKPFTGTRTRAGFLILFSFLVVILAQSVDFADLLRRLVAIFHSPPLSSSSSHVASSEAFPSTAVGDLHQ